MDAKTLKEAARRAGAELVGIAPAPSWEKWQGSANPRNIQPMCQSVIVLGRSIVRGALRGVEEGTNFGTLTMIMERIEREDIPYPNNTSGRPRS